MQNQKRENSKGSERKTQKKSCRVNDASIHHLEMLNMAFWKIETNRKTTGAASVDQIGRAHV